MMRGSFVHGNQQVRVQKRPGSAFLREPEESKCPARPESAFRKSVDNYSHHTLGKKMNDNKRFTGVQPDPRAVAFQNINRNLDDFSALKERIEGLKKKYN